MSVRLWNGGAWVDRVALNTVVIDLDSNDEDQTTSLLNQLSLASDGANSDSPTTILMPPGRFRIDGSVTINSRNNLVIRSRYPENPFVGYTDLFGQDAGFEDGNGDSTRAHWVISGSNNIKIKHIFVEGPNTFREVNDPRFAL